MHLTLLCKRYGEVEDVQLVRHTVGPHRGLPKGFAFVTMARPEVSAEMRSLLATGLSQGERAEQHSKNLIGMPLFLI